MSTLTREQILAMPAGPDMDALIHQHVFGAEVWESEPWHGPPEGEDCVVVRLKARPMPAFSRGEDALDVCRAALLLALKLS